MKCVKCGSKIKNNFKLCPTCGEKVEIKINDKNIKFNKKLILILSLIFVVLFTSVYFIFFKSESIKTIRQSVVKINVYDKDGEVIQTGSGFIIFDKNIMVTNAHVITGGHSADAVSEVDEKIYINGAIYYSQDEDIAILKLNNQNSLKPLKMSTNYDVGDKVIAIGSPLGIKNSVSDGMISNIEDNVIQHTAPISSGSSGGTLFNSKGKVIGMNTATITSGQNINLAIPIETIKKAYESSKDNKVKKIRNIQYTTDENIKSIILNNNSGKKIIDIINKNSKNNSIYATDMQDYKNAFVSGYYMYKIADNNLANDWIDINVNNEFDSNDKFIESKIPFFRIIKLNTDSSEVVEQIENEFRNDVYDRYIQILKDPKEEVVSPTIDSNGNLVIDNNTKTLIGNYSSKYIDAYKNPTIGYYNGYVYLIVCSDNDITKDIVKQIKQLP